MAESIIEQMARAAHIEGYHLSPMKAMYPQEWENVPGWWRNSALLQMRAALAELRQTGQFLDIDAALGGK